MSDGNGKLSYKGTTLIPYISPLGAWALGIGCSIGWGSFVVTTNNYLSVAGPAGSTAGLCISAVLMLIISMNYHFLIKRHPSAGGLYTYARENLGYDDGFLTMWFLGLTYIAVFWANLTSLPLFARYFFGDVLRTGYLYTIFGYDVYLGETLLVIAAAAVVGILCSCSRAGLVRIMIGLSLLFTLAIIVCFLAAMVQHGSSGHSFSPVLMKDTAPLSQILHIATISPWAFIGFENISHSAEEFRFEKKKSFSILAGVVVMTTLLYTCVFLLSVSAYPLEYDSWYEYITDIGNLSGLKALPAFYAAGYYMGDTGILLLALALLALVVTSLIGNITALSRLLFAAGRDGTIPGYFARLNRKHIPWRAILLICAVSAAIPFLGRTAIGWIVDVTTIGATIIYGYVSFAALKAGKKEKSKKYIASGTAGVALMVVSCILLMVPNIIGERQMTTESYLLFIAWAILGFIAFHLLLRKDRERQYGKSVVVWTALLGLVVVVSLIWMTETSRNATNDAMNMIHQYVIGEASAADYAAGGEAYLDSAVQRVHRANDMSGMMAMLVFTLSTCIMLSNFLLMKKRDQMSHEALGKARVEANRDALTGVKNRRAYEQYEADLDMQLENGTVHEFAVAVCDMNNLKKVNDRFGHQMGDEIIRKACYMICIQFKHSPVFRVGGDEFVVILRGKDYDTREEILRTFEEENMQNREEDNHIEIALGIAEFDPEQDGSLQDVFERADEMMYRRKAEMKEAC